jgi:hypothetical protein
MLEEHPMNAARRTALLIGLTVFLIVLILGAFPIGTIAQAHGAKASLGPLLISALAGLTAAVYALIEAMLVRALEAPSRQ